MHFARTSHATITLEAFTFPAAWGPSVQDEAASWCCEADRQVGQVELVFDTLAQTSLAILDVTQAVNRWLSGALENNGLAIRVQKGGGCGAWSLPAFQEDQEDDQLEGRKMKGTKNHPRDNPGDYPTDMSGESIPLSPVLELVLPVDNTSPTIYFQTVPSTTTSKTDARFTFSGVDHESGVDRFECSSNHADWIRCRSPLVLQDLSEGPQYFSVLAVDKAGNKGTTSNYTWTIKPLQNPMESKPQLISILTGPPALSSSASATFLFSSAHSKSMLCSLDEADFVKCHSPTTFAGLSQGNHTLRILAEGTPISSSTSWSWTVDLPSRCHISSPSLSPPTSSSSPSSLSSSSSFHRPAPPPSPLPLHFALSRRSPAFSPANILLGGVGGSLSHWQASPDGRSFSAMLTPTADGTVTVKVGGGEEPGQRWWGSSNTLVVTFDTTPPTCTISGPSSKQSSPFQVAFAWTEPVSDFDPASVIIDGLGWFEPMFNASSMGSWFHGLVHPLGSGELRVEVKEAAAKDFAGLISETHSNIMVFELLSSNLHVALPHLQRVDIVGESGVAIEGLTGIPGATTLEVDRQGRVYLGAGYQLLVYSSRKKLLSTLSGFKNVTGVDVHEGEDGTVTVFVADADAHQVQIFWWREGDDWRAEGTMGEAADGPRLQAPMGLEFDGAAELLYVTDAELRTVLVYRAWGEYVGRLGSEEPGRLELGSPVAVEVDPRGRLLVADQGMNQVVVYSRNGTRLRVLGTEGSTNESKMGLLSPGAVEVDQSGVIYVADGVRGTVHVFNSDLEYTGVIEGVAGAFALGIYRDEEGPKCTADGPSGVQGGEPFKVSFRWSEPVEGFDPEDIAVEGVGGNVTGLASHDGRVYTATVTPSSAGVVKVKSLAGGVVNMNGVVNVDNSPSVEVVVSGSECALEAACKWELAVFEHHLSLARLQEEANLQTKRAMDLLRFRQQGERQSEELRLQTERELTKMRFDAEALKAEIERDTVYERAAAETEGRVKEARDTEDLHLRALASQGDHQRRAALAVVDAAASHFGTGFQDLISSKKKLQTIVGVVGAVACVISFAREFSKVVSRQIQKWLGQPSLVRISTRSGFPSSLLPLNMLRSILRIRPGTPFSDVVLPVALMNRMRQVAQTTSNTKKRGAPFRNLLLYGPPGTGKTMAAERLARAVGMEYAVMSGGDVVPLGQHAVAELNSLFDWAQRSRKGVLLLVDEADAFLRHRDSAGMSEHMRSALNALLARTGTQSNNLMLVLVTNRPDDLDPAVMDRMDDLVEFPLPAQNERLGLLKMYLRLYLPQFASLSWRHRRSLIVEHKGISDEVIQQLLEATEGFSGREAAKLMAGVQALVYGRDGSPVVTPEDLFQITELKRQEHQRKLAHFAADPLGQISK